jgi:tetratricopeptide (TPR) repeat protein
MKRLFHIVKEAELSELERSYHLNDLGYVYACLGEYERARFFCNEGLKIRKNLLSEYLIGLSFNTLGLIEYMADSPGAGKTYCEKALRIFEQIGDMRGKGLAHRALGGILARIADRGDSIKDLEDAENHLNKAIDIFIREGTPVESVYMAETYMRMGLMYTTWRRIAQSQGIEKSKQDEYYRRARFSFQRGIIEFERANSTSRLANAIGRLAKLYLDSGEMESAGFEIEKTKKILENQGYDFSRVFDENFLIEIKNERKEFLHPIARLLHLKSVLYFRQYQENRNDSSHLIASATYFAAAYAFMVNFSKNAFDTTGILKELSNFMKELEQIERTVFTDEIKKAIKNYPQTDFLELLKRLKDTEMV